MTNENKNQSQTILEIIPDYGGDNSLTDEQIAEIEKHAAMEIGTIQHDALDVVSAMFGTLPDEDIGHADLVALTEMLLSSDGTGGGSDVPTPIINVPAYYDGTVDTPDADDPAPESDESPSTSFWEDMPADMAAWFDESRFSECLSDDETGDNA